MDKSILEIFGEKSKDGDKAIGLLNALLVNSYKDGGMIEKSYKTEQGAYEDADPLYIASGIGKGTITEKEWNQKGIIPLLQRLLPGGKTGKSKSRGWSADKDAVDYDFIHDLKGILDKSGGKLVDFQDPDFDPKSEKTESLQELAEFLSTQVKSKMTSEFEERTEGDKSEIIKDLYRSSTQTQSPYSDLGFFSEQSEDSKGFQEAAGQLLKGIPLMEAINVIGKKK